MKLTIGDVTLENNVILAPMAGVTDLPFRLLCKEQGAGLLCMEMVSAKAVHYNIRAQKLFWRFIRRKSLCPCNYLVQSRILWQRQQPE